MSSPSESRVIIIGAGWTGLAVAKTYLSLFPTISLTIIDADTTVGGVWSASRVYPGLVADSCAAIFDFSDFPMDEVMGLDKWADLPAQKVQDYLEKYVDRFGLRGRLRLGCRVVGVTKEKEGGGWSLEVQNVGEERKEVLRCEKLIVATGTSSTPNLPEDIDWKKFEGPVMHSKDVGTKHQLLTSNAVRRVTVVGGNKSAVDVVNLCALAGIEVDWVIRKEGFGPGYLFEARSHGIHAGAIKAARASAVPSPNILATKGFWYWFFHSGKSRVGTSLLRFMLSKLSDSAMDMYKRNENTMKIAPDVDIVWSNSGVSVVHDNSTFFDMVAEGKLIHVHRASITSFSSHSVSLSNDEILPCDAAVFATGWKMNQPIIFPPSLLPDLGFPYHITSQSPEAAKHWDALDSSSEDQVRSLFPMLAKPPPEIIEYDKIHIKPATLTPFRLFRYIAPPTLAARGDHSLIVLGCLLSTAIPTYAEISSLWGVAYLENLPFISSTSGVLEDLNTMEKDISLINSWAFLKCRDRGAPYLDGSAEIQNFMDLLIRDLGLRTDRKRLAAERKGKRGVFGLRTWVKKWFSPYVGSDYRGLVEEYRSRWGLTVK